VSTPCAPAHQGSLPPAAIRIRRWPARLASHGSPATHSWLIGDARPLAAATALLAAADRYVQELGPNRTGRYDRSGRHQLRFWKELG